MKRTTAVLLALGLLLMTAAAPDAEAGWRKKGKNKKLSDKRTEKPEEMKAAHRSGAGADDGLPDGRARSATRSPAGRSAT